jgi:hypothetical protein
LNPHELPATTIRVLRFFFAAHARRGGLQNAGRTTVRRNRIRPRGSRSFELVELSSDLFSLSHRSARFVGRRGSVLGIVGWDPAGKLRWLLPISVGTIIAQAVVSCVRARSNGKLLDRDKGDSKLALTDADLLRAMPQTRTLEGKIRCCTSRQNCPGELIAMTVHHIFLLECDDHGE